MSASPISTGCEDEEAQAPRRLSRLSSIRRTATGTNAPTESLRSGPMPRPTRRETFRSQVENPQRADLFVTHGYPQLASFLGGVKGYSIYRRFAYLNSRNLLYEQAKLTRLEHELMDIEAEHKLEIDLHYNINHIFEDDVSPAGARVKACYERISQALNRYNHLLLEQQKLHKLQPPDRSVVQRIRDFIASSAYEEHHKSDWLSHPEDTTYAMCTTDGYPAQEDLVSLSPSAQDSFTRLFSDHIEPKEGMGIEMWVYKEEAMSRVVDSIAIVIAAALPATSVIALYYIYRPVWRLIFIVFFSIVFALALRYFTEAKRIEIFAASTALASVQVVFVGTAFGSSGNNC